MDEMDNRNDQRLRKDMDKLKINMKDELNKLKDGLKNMIKEEIMEVKCSIRNIMKGELSEIQSSLKCLIKEEQMDMKCCIRDIIKEELQEIKEKLSILPVIEVEVKQENADVTTDSVQENNIAIENVRSISSLEGENSAAKFEHHEENHANNGQPYLVSEITELDNITNVTKSNIISSETILPNNNHSESTLGPTIANDDNSGLFLRNTDNSLVDINVYSFEPNKRSRTVRNRKAKEQFLTCKVST